MAAGPGARAFIPMQKLKAKQINFLPRSSLALVLLWGGWDLGVAKLAMPRTRIAFSYLRTLKPVVNCQSAGWVALRNRSRTVLEQWLCGRSGLPRARIVA